MSKFITPVSMQVTKEQYKNDLRQPLLDLGYEEEYFYNSFNPINYNYLVTNYSRKESCIGYNVHFSLKNDNNRYSIENYNPQLFLALAAMKEGDKFHVGEYVWITKKRSTSSFRFNGCLKRIRKVSISHICVDDDLNGLHNDECRKATKEELIKYFSHKKFYAKGIDPAMEGHLEMLEEVEKNMTNVSCAKSEPFVLPEKWYVRATKSNAKILGEYFSSQSNNDCYRKDTMNQFHKGYYHSHNHVDESILNKGTLNASFHRGITKKYFEEITFEQFKKHVLNMKKERFPFSLKPQDAQRIIDIACGTWKEKLAVDCKWAKNIVLKKDIVIIESFYKQMRKACTDEQNKLFDEIFGKDTVECKFKVGDYIVFKNIDNTFYITGITDGEVITRPVVNNLHNPNNTYNNIEMMLQKCKHDIGTTNKEAELWSVEYAKKGEAVFISKTYLRYCDGKGKFYLDGRKNGKTNDIDSKNYTIIPFDMLNLPFNE